MIESNLILKIIDGDDGDPKARIADAAIEEFALRSLDGARIREIARKSNTNVAAISYHFGGKEGLYKAVISAMSDYFDDFVGGYYAEGEKIIESGDAEKSKNFAEKFLIDAIKKFSQVKIVPALCLIMTREATSPSEYFQRVYDSIYRKPVEFLAKLFETAAKGRIPHDVGVVFAQALWANVRSYTSKSDAVLKLHNWTSFGAPEIALLETALTKVLSKTFA